MRKSILIVFCLTALAVIMCAGAASAKELYSNFGPGDSYDMDGGWVVADYQAVAMPFNVSGGDYLLDSIQVAMQFEDPSAYTISLMDDSGGLPGSALESFSVTDMPAGIWSFTSVDKPLLKDGSTYWVALESTDPDAYNGWCYNNQSVYGPWAFTFGDGVWISWNDITSAFRVNGSPVPEPSSLIALLSGLGGLGTLIRRKR